MTDPEVQYRRLLAGDAAAIRSAAEALRTESRSLVTAREDIEYAATVPFWKGAAAFAFARRSGGLVDAVHTSELMVTRVAGGLEAAASSYDHVVEAAEFYIGFWRNRPAWLPEAIEELLARQVNARLLDVGREYDDNLRTIASVLAGDDVDPDEVDDDLRDWVEQGQDKTDDWRDETGSDLGPQIPNTAATGDDRGWIPQGSAYDPATRSILQAYYDDDGPSTLAVVDEVTGTEITEVELGNLVTQDGRTVEVDSPGHVGGVAIDGDHVYITDSNRVYQYSLSELRGAGPGETVNPTAPPQAVQKGSYSAYRHPYLYVGDFSGNTMQRYEKVGGDWEEVGDPIPTPENTQGVLVRDGEYVYSTSYGRHEGSALVVEDIGSGERSDPYDIPNMSQSVFEIDGDIVVGYESGAGKFSESATGGWGWFWGVPDEDSLWASTHWTRTPLSELGLDEDLEVEPATLESAARELQSPADVLADARSTLGGLEVPAHVFGTVPAAPVVSRSVRTLLGGLASSLGVGSRAVSLVSDRLAQSAVRYGEADLLSGVRFKGLLPF